ncbi:MAG TPA: hypothetical protein VF916_05100 [Ktedonobacterales bacterium]
MTGTAHSAGGREPRCVALAQEHRGHGVSTAAYYLGRALVERGFHVLLGDLSQRPSTLARLAAQEPVKNLVAWTPQPVHPSDLTRTLRGARQRTAGVADVLLLDADAALVEQGGGSGAGIDYVLLFVEHTEQGQRSAVRLVKRLGGGEGTRRRIGVVFCRVDVPAADDLPQRLEGDIPVLGWLPADYLLAAGEAYSFKGGSPARPHQAYMSALARMAQTLVRVVPLQRVDTPQARSG